MWGAAIAAIGEAVKSWFDILFGLSTLLLCRAFLMATNQKTASGSRTGQLPTYYLWMEVGLQHEHGARVECRGHHQVLR